MLEGAIAAAAETFSLVAKHSVLIEAVIQLVENHQVDQATLLAALEDALKTTSDAQMKKELGA